MEGREQNQIGVVNGRRDFSFSNCCLFCKWPYCVEVSDRGALVRKNGGEYFQNADTKTGEKGTQHLVICFSKLSLMM